jgi:hypothetical protein
MSTILFRGIQQQPWIAFLIIIVLLTFNSLEMSRAATENPENVSVVELTFTGTGSGKTQLFTVEDGWKIQWETESPTFKLSAHGSARRPYAGPTNEREEILRWFEVLEPIVLANTTNQHGKAVHPLGGTFYLKIVATGAWRIRLKTFKDTKDYLDVPYTGAP